MGKKLTGMLNLSRIPKGLITKNRKGESVIWVDVVETESPDKYGNTHVVTMYNKNGGEHKTIYLANLREKEFGGGNNAPSNDLPEGDLPW